MDKLGERHGALTIIARSTKTANGYLHYYWVRCECGYVKRLRYDQVRKGKPCGMCADFKASDVLGRVDHGKE